jgi:hypothetical protein
MDTGGIKYVVVTADGEEEPCLFHELNAPRLCSSKEQAEALIGAAAGRDAKDWSVFEVVDGRCVRRSVVFKAEGPEVQPA